jgi:hypothetical protein
MIARIVAVDLRSDPGVVSYELHDEDGLALLVRINHATLDEGWWHAFQPMIRRFG